MYILIVAKYFFSYLNKNQFIEIVMLYLFETLVFKYSDKLLYKIFILYASIGFFISNYFLNQFSIYKEALLMLKLYPLGLLKLLKAHLLLNKLIIIFLFLLSLFVAFKFPGFIDKKILVSLLLNMFLAILYVPILYLYLSTKKVLPLNFSQNINKLRVLAEDIVLSIVILILTEITILGIEYPFINISIFLVFLFLWICIKKRKNLKNYF